MKRQKHRKQWGQAMHLRKRDARKSEQGELEAEERRKGVASRLHTRIEGEKKACKTQGRKGGQNSSKEQVDWPVSQKHMFFSKCQVPRRRAATAAASPMKALHLCKGTWCASKKRENKELEVRASAGSCRSGTSRRAHAEVRHTTVWNDLGQKARWHRRKAP